MVRAFLCLDSYFLLVYLHGGSTVLYCLFGLFFVLVWGFGLCILRLLGGIFCAFFFYFLILACNY